MDKDRREFMIFDDKITYTLPMLKEGLDKTYDLEDDVSGVSLTQKDGFVTLSKEGYYPKCFVDRNFDWMLYVGYVRKDV